MFLSTKVLLQTDLAVSKTITGLLIPYPFVSRFSAIPWGIHHLPQVQHMHSGVWLHIWSAYNKIHLSAMSVSITCRHTLTLSQHRKAVATLGNVLSAMMQCSELLMRLIINMATICLRHEQWAGCKGNLHALPCQQQDQSTASTGCTHSKSSLVPVPWP